MRRSIILLVLVLVVVLGVGILAAGTLQVKTAAERSQCRNNLRQIGLALHNCHDNFNTFPAGAVPSPDLPPERRLSWQFYCIIFMESRMGDSSWHDAIKMAWDAEEGRAFKMEPLRYYLCPSASVTQDANGYGLTHYVGIAGVGTDAPMLPLSDRRAGVFGYERKTRLEDIEDGRDTTLLAIETATANGPWAAAGRSTVRGMDPDDPPYLGRGSQFSSRHQSRLANAVFADASVRPLKESLSPQVLEAFATVAGREAVDPVERH